MNVAVKIATNSAWGLLPFEEAVTDATSGNHKIPQKEYLSAGELPVIDQGQQEIGGYVDDVSLKCKEELPCIVFGDHTKSIKFIDYDFALGADGVKVLVPKRNDIDKKYLYRFLQTIKLPDDAGYSRHYKFLKRAMVPIPPLDEQKRIAGILDKADAIRRKRAESLKLLDELLRATFLDMFGDPITNPKGWPIVELSKIITSLTSGSRGWATYYSKEGAKFLRIQNVGKNELLLNDIAFVNAPKNAEAKRTLVKSGDILLSITADLGRTAVVPDDFGEGYINQHLAKFSIQNADPLYVSAYIASLGGQAQIAKKNKGGTKAGLNFDDIKSIKVPMPPITAQKKYSDFWSKIQESKQQFCGHATESDTLFDSLVARAFKGEL